MRLEKIFLIISIILAIASYWYLPLLLIAMILLLGVARSVR